MSRRGVPFRDVLRLTFTKVVPLGLALGAGMEVFMYYTGFWKTATRKEAERTVEAKQTRQHLRASHQTTSSTELPNATGKQEPNAESALK